MPFWTVRERMALAMLALITVTTPSAASRSDMPSSRASSPITRRAAISSSDIPPPDPAARPILVERHPAAKEILAVEPAQHDVGVGHGCPVAAAAVGGGAR